MDPAIFQVLALLVVALLLFASELVAVDIVAICLLLFLVGSNLLDISSALAGFGHPAVVGVGALFVVSEGLLRTGALGFLSNRLLKWSGGHQGLLTILILIIVLVASAFLNNTPVVAMFIPVVLGTCLKTGVNPSKILIPLSYAAILGGTCTLIGTSTNILVSSIARESAGIELGMFDFTRLGGLLAVIGLVYLIFIGPKLVPERQTITSLASLGGDRRQREYVTEVEIRGGELVGSRFGDTLLASSGKVRILQVIRGESIIWPPLDDLVLREGDALVISGTIEELMKLQEGSDVASLAEIVSESQGTPHEKEAELAELLVLPNSRFMGQTLGSMELRRRFGLHVLAIQRHGMHMRSKISEHPLRAGDVLLIQGTPDSLERIRGEEGLVLMSGVEDVLVKKEKEPIAIGILCLVTILLGTQALPMAAIALGGAVLMILSGCISGTKAYESIQWRILVLIAGMLAMGQAMDQTGAAQWIAEQVSGLQGTLGAEGLVVVTLIVAALLTEMISNAAVAAVLVPVSLKIASQLEVSPEPFIMAVAFGAKVPWTNS